MSFPFIENSRFFSHTMKFRSYGALAAIKNIIYTHLTALQPATNGLIEIPRHYSILSLFVFD